MVAKSKKAIQPDNQERPWSLQQFMELPAPPKDALIQDLLYRRDLVAMVGRRRHGKTTFNLNLALALALGRSNLLGFPIPRSAKVYACLLEDDTREIQERFSKTLGPSINPKSIPNLAISTKELFVSKNIRPTISNQKFCDLIKQYCDSFGPDLVIIDNATMLVEGDFNNHRTVWELSQFCSTISQTYNCSVTVPAHPRKDTGTSNHRDEVSLKSDPGRFIEEVLGSSVFINAFGSSWGLQRLPDDLSYFLGGSQRYRGTQKIIPIRKHADDDWFELATDTASLTLALNTDARKLAWTSLPDEFTYSEARDASKTHIRSKDAFTTWWKLLAKLDLIYITDDVSQSKYSKSASALAFGPDLG